MSNTIDKPIKRVDACDKAAGITRYLADIPIEGILHAKLLRAKVARASIRHIEIPPLPDGFHYVDWRDVPGENRIPLINRDWPVFVEEQVRFAGEVVALIIGPDKETILEIESAIRIEYDELRPVFTPEKSASLLGGPIFGSDNLFGDYNLQKGEPEKAFREADRIVEGTYETGFQEHIYLEPQSLNGFHREGKIVIQGSIQCPYYVKHAVVNALGCGEEKVRVIQTPTGGAFGGKEDYPEVIGAPLAVAVHKIGRPIQLILDRVEDIAFTSKRHPSKITIKTALDAKGDILGMDIDTRLNGGAYESYSCIVLQRTVFHATGVYEIPHVKLRGRAFATNFPPNGAFRGFGAPQAFFAIESHMNHLARETGRDHLELRRQYFLQKGSVTVTNGTIRDDVLLDRMFETINRSSDYLNKRKLYASQLGKGIGIAFYNHGCGFTGDGEQRIIKARVAIEKSSSASARILVANTEMGQGVATTFTKIVANILELPVENILYGPPDTDVVPDSGPTAASRSVMVVGYLLQEAAKELKERWQEAKTLKVEKRYQMPEGIEWDQASMQGDAYPTYGWGINVVEVEVDSATYEIEVKHVWTVHEVGKAIDEKVVNGQAIGGVSQALGWGCLEKMEHKNGLFLQNTMADYMIPTSMDYPETESKLIDNPYPFGPFGAKGAGELVFNGAAAALSSAVEHALDRPFYKIPITGETILETLQSEN